MVSSRESVTYPPAFPFLPLTFSNTRHLHHLQLRLEPSRSTCSENCRSEVLQARRVSSSSCWIIDEVVVHVSKRRVSSVVIWSTGAQLRPICHCSTLSRYWFAAGPTQNVIARKGRLVGISFRSDVHQHSLERGPSCASVFGAAVLGGPVFVCRFSALGAHRGSREPRERPRLAK